MNYVYSTPEFIIMTFSALVVLIALLLMFLYKKYPSIKINTVKIVCLVFVIIQAVSTMFVVQRNTVPIEQKQLQAEYLKEAEEQLAKKYPEKVYSQKNITETEELTKQSALDFVHKMLLKVKDGEVTPEERFKQISEKPEVYKDVISHDVLDRIRLVEELDIDQVYANTSIALLSAVNSIKEKNETIEIVNKSLDLVYLDKETNSAYVSFQAFTPLASGLSVHLIYHNNAWYIEPYSMLNTLQVVEMTTINIGEQNQEKEQTNSEITTSNH